MSDYFGALMRAAGLKLSGAAPAEAVAARGWTPADPFEAAESSTQPDPPVALQPAAHPAASAPLVAADPVADSAPAAATREAAPRTSSEVGLHEARPRPEAALETDAVSTEAASLAQARVDAAVRWVRAPHEDAAAARQLRADAQPGAERFPARPASDNQTTSGRETAFDPIDAARTPALAPESRRTPAVLAAPIMPQASSAGAPALQDGPVEVSIGSIHLRVEVPAPQSAIAAPAPTPAAAPAPSRRGSAFARRALRRI